jgi:fructose-1,6-bisphosphatase II
MASTQHHAEAAGGEDGREPAGRCQCTDLAAVTEASALAAGRFLGRGDATAADQAASRAMRESLAGVPISGKLVIGREAEGHDLSEGVELGAGGRELDLACDPVGNGAAVAGGRPGALSILAASDPGGLMQVPRMYMRKMAVGPVAKGRIDLRRPVAENLEAIADAFGRRIADVTAIVLDRPRHDDLIDEIRETGARIKLIGDGDIMASISAAIRGTNDHLAIGIGGAHEGVISAAALRCLGGEIQGQLWPMSRTEINRAADDGIEDVSRIFGIDDLVRGHQTVVATGISGSDLLRGVRYMAEGARTQSLVLCSRCNRVRFIDSIHLFSGDRHEEIRL